jgi:hypothetical protein
VVVRRVNMSIRGRRFARAPPLIGSPRPPRPPNAPISYGAGSHFRSAALRRFRIPQPEDRAGSEVISSGVRFRTIWADKSRKME